MRRIVFGLLLAVALPGCQKYGYVPVTGRVTVDGVPAVGARVLFQPHRPGVAEPGLGSVGQTDSDGRFALKTADRKSDGASPGLHKVAVYGNDDPGKDHPGPKVPGKYGNESPLTFEVPAGGTTAADFALASKGEK